MQCQPTAPRVEEHPDRRFAHVEQAPNPAKSLVSIISRLLMCLHCIQTVFIMVCVATVHRVLSVGTLGDIGKKSCVGAWLLSTQYGCAHALCIGKTPSFVAASA